jgi:murein DD-endopeptidase MepM/ murein hydrolase activator NlpD
MAKRLVLAPALVAALAAPALAGDNYGQQKASVDAKLATLHTKLARDHAKASQLSSQIGGLTSEIRTLETQVGDVSTRLAALQSDLTLHRRRLAKLDQLYRLQTVRFGDLRRQYTLAVKRLNLRLVDIYKENDPTTLDLLLAARSFNDILDQLDYLNAIAVQDKQVAGQVATAKRQVRVARSNTVEARQNVQREARVISARVQQAAILRGELLSHKSRLTAVRASKSSALVTTRNQVQDEIQESRALETASAQLAEKLREAEAQARARAAAAGGSDAGGSPPVTSSSESASAPASSAGFIWPVSGPITSPFGMRWGTLHPGIDIGVPTGTPIHAAASGTVVWCGWMEGYGNLVMIDHHNGLATLYGHQSSVAVSCNQEVSQGELIGYSGCTGYCTGPHVHFEVRVNGTPVDPLGYLP